MTHAAILERLDLGALVPEEFGALRDVFRGGLERFLSRLPPARIDRLAEVLGEVASADGPHAHLMAFLRHCPSLHKFGQLIARRRDIDPGLRLLLQGLESLHSGRRDENVRRAVEDGLGPWKSRYHIDVGEAPLAEASVAVVVPVAWRDESGVTRDGVVKLLKPHVTDFLMQELDALAEVADFLEAESRTHGLPPLEYRATYDDVRTLLEHEVDLAAEQTHLGAAATAYAGHPDVCVPALLPFCTPSLIAMQRVRGVKVTDGSGGAAERDRLAATIVRALLADVLFSPHDEAIFHADPHAGNLFALEDGRLGLLDWSLAGRLTRDQRRQIVQIVAGALTLDPSRIARAVAALAIDPPRPGAVEPVIERSLRRVAAGRLPGLAWLVGLLDGMASAGVRFPPRLLLMRKTLWLLMSVLADLAPDFQADMVLVGATWQAFMREWPHRFTAGVGDLGPSTHLSNLDLLELGLSAPWSLAAYWVRSWQFWRTPADDPGATAESSRWK